MKVQVLIDKEDYDTLVNRIQILEQTNATWERAKAPELAEMACQAIDRLIVSLLELPGSQFQHVADFMKRRRSQLIEEILTSQRIKNHNEPIRSNH